MHGAVAIRIRYTKYSIYYQTNSTIFCIQFLNATAPFGRKMTYGKHVSGSEKKIDISVSTVYNEYIQLIQRNRRS